MKLWLKILIAFLIVSGLILMLQWLATKFYISPEVEQIAPPISEFKDGAIKTLYADSTLKSKVDYLGGLKHGKSIHYFRNGKIQMLENYQKGKLEGKGYYFSNSGGLVNINTYKGGEVIEEVVLNDSLYNYELYRIDYGMHLYEIRCKSCHENTPDDFNSALQMVQDSTKGSKSVSILALHKKIDIKTSFDSLADTSHLKLLDLEVLLDYGKMKNTRHIKYPTIKKLRFKSKKI